jgi:hypothetical protein
MAVDMAYMINLLQAINLRTKGKQLRSQPEDVNDLGMNTSGARLWLWRGCGYGKGVVMARLISLKLLNPA